LAYKLSQALANPDKLIPNSWAFCCSMPLTKHPETRGKIEATILPSVVQEYFLIFLIMFECLVLKIKNLLMEWEFSKDRFFEHSLQTSLVRQENLLYNLLCSFCGLIC